MDKKDFQATEQGRELIAIEQLSQQLQTLFKQMEQIRRENFLFQSYLMRLQKQHKKDIKHEQQQKKKVTKGKKSQDKRNLMLTPEEKYQIAQYQADALKENIEKGRVKSDAILQTLRAILEQTDMSIAQIRKDAYDFQRQILLGGQNSRTGKIEAERIQKFFQQKQRQKKSLLQKYKSKKSTITSQIIKTNNQIMKKEEMGDELKFIDFHQLQIENKKYVKEIEEKNESLMKFKINYSKIAAEFLESNKTLNNLMSQITKYELEIKEKQDMINQSKVNLVELENKRSKLNLKKRTLQSQADQMKEPSNSDIPNTMTYVVQKRTQEKLLYEKKNLERKILIAESVYEKARKALGLHG